MPTLQILIIFPLCFFFFIPDHIGTARAAACAESACSSSYISSIPIRFPFQLKTLEPSRCGYEGFDVSCNKSNQSQTLLTLPSSGDFIVQGIYYLSQRLVIADPANCLPRRFLEHDFSLIGSPFSFVDGLENYTFLNCSYHVETSHGSISCLTNELYKVIGVPSKSINFSAPCLCSVISTALVPLSGSFDSDGWDLLNYYFELAWDVPDCRFCEQSGNVCGFKDGKSSELKCSSLSRTANYAFTAFTGIIAIIFVVALVLQLRDSRRAHQPMTELSTVTDRRPLVIRIGLDDATIESYPKTQLGESWELPKPNDNTCPICLGTYKPTETLRTISECNHYFHANCVDEWLKVSATCPLCRNPSKGNKISHLATEA
ncbi:hypothetical protein CerSpe_182170 [Prunus speciosa]